jgi:catechol 2,3-dioxygenase-like lactoylglutathione lyase family enzyme
MIWQGCSIMLVDCELMGAERRFELPVADVQRAWSFYRDIMGAEEVFRSESDVRVPTRIGFAIGRAGFMITAQGPAEADHSRPALALLATEFSEPFAAVVLYVQAPTGAVQRALEAGSHFRPEAASATASYCGNPVEVIIDPFGRSWAFAKSSEGYLW